MRWASLMDWMGYALTQFPRARFLRNPQTTGLRTPERRGPAAASHRCSGDGCVVPRRALVGDGRGTRLRRSGAGRKSVLGDGDLEA